jgi:hypothetical protein
MDTATRTEEARRSARSPALWAGVLVPPAAWLAQLLVSDLLYELGCAPGGGGGVVFGLGVEVWSFLVGVVAAAATIVAGVFTFRAWRRTAGGLHEPTWSGRAREMGWWGLVSVGIYLLIIVFGLFPPLVMDRCPAPL